MSKQPPGDSITLRGSVKDAARGHLSRRSTSVFTLSPQSSLQAHRFDEFLRSLGPRLAAMEPSLRVALCGLAYEGICSRHQYDGLLNVILAAEPAPGGKRVVLPDHDKRPGRNQIRLLSARTLRSLHCLNAPFEPTKVTKRVSDWLSAHYPASSDFVDDSILEKVLQDASAWLYTCLPSAGYSHIREELPIQALPTGVINRLSPLHRSTDTRLGADTESDAEGDGTFTLIAEHALDQMMAPSEKTSAGMPTRTIAALKGVATVRREGQTIRVADHIAQAHARQSLVGIVDVIRDEGHVAAVLVGWAMHLFTAGSLQRANPAISTISAYINALIDPLAKTLVALDRPLVALDSRDWYRFFNKLAAHSGSQVFGPALATFHLWVVETYGCDPMPGIIFNKVEEIQVHANVIWPHEREALLIKAGTASLDHRVNQQVQVMAALGSGGTFRIGDLMPMRISQIVPLSSGLQVTCNPGPKWHKGKGKGARRTVHIPAGWECELIKSWVTMRRKESFDDQELLFGDPNQPDRLYRFAHCNLLVNRLLKQITGDDSVSFHTLRHTRASDSGIAMCNEQKSCAISPLDVSQNAMGHRTRRTQWATYFHFPEYAIRNAIDATHAVHLMEEKEAEFWTDGSTGALRKAKSRATKVLGEEAGARYYFNTVQQLAIGSTSWRHEPGHAVNLTPSMEVQTRAVDVDFTLKWVIHALKNVVLTDELDVACSRMSCLPQHIEQLGHAVAAVAESLDPLTASLIKTSLSPGADANASATWIRAVVARHALQLDLGKSPQVMNLVKQASSSGRDAMTAAAAAAWQRCKRAGSISLERLHLAAPIVKFLLAAQVPTSCFIARLQKCGTDQATQQDELDRFASEWLNVMGFECPVEWVKKRPGRPEKYLVLKTRPHGGRQAASPASTPMGGLHGFFFCLAVTHQLKDVKAMR